MTKNEKRFIFISDNIVKIVIAVFIAIVLIVTISLIIFTTHISTNASSFMREEDSSILDSEFDSELPVTATTATTTPTTVKKPDTKPTIKKTVKENYPTYHVSGQYTETSMFTYYINENENNAIYMMKHDGSDKKKVCENARELLGAIGDDIYYTKKSDFLSYRITDDGSNETQITTETIDSVYFGKNWILFFESPYKGEAVLYKMKLDGTGKTVVNEKCPTIEVYCCDGFLYFNNADLLRFSDETGEVESMGVRTPYEALYTSTAVCFAENESIYLCPFSTKEKKLIYKCTEDLEDFVGSDVVVLTVDNDYIYFYEKVAGNKFFKMKKDGTGRTALNNDYFHLCGQRVTPSGWGISREMINGTIKNILYNPKTSQILEM